VWLHEIVNRQEKVMWWKLISPRLGRLGLELVLLAGLLIYSAELHDFMHKMLATKDIVFEFSSYAYWAVIGVVCLTLCVAIWRSISALSMIVADVSIDRSSQARHLRPIIRLAGQTVGAIALLSFVKVLFPVPLSGTVAWLIVFAASLVFIVVFWRKLIQWHSRFQHSLDVVVSGSAPSLTSTVTPQQSEFWNAQLAECVLPDNAACNMKSIASLDLRRQFGCIIVEIERHGELMANPAPDTILFPGDKLLLFGSGRNIKPALNFLQTETVRTTDSVVSTVGLETFAVPANSGRIGHSLADLQIFAKTGVQVLGIERDGQATLNPSANHQLKTGDKLLVLCNGAQAKKFRKWLSE
jgi:CPA2 family monovalent cation:H+ antiporter-2